MPSGGHARSGPPPNPTALRRERDIGDWITLPASGRPGPPPDWPLTKATAREGRIWAELWAKPQAIMWEKLGQATEVALYVRRLTVAESRKAPTNAVTIVRQLADSLGLTTPGLAHNKWRIERQSTNQATTDDPVAPFRPRLVADAVEGT